MQSPLLLALPLLAAAFVSPAGLTPQREIAAKYHELAAKEDHAGLVALWKENPGAILYTIDADLEGSLAEVEKSEAPDREKIAMLHARALFGAQAAEEATGRPIFVEYASSFVGWTREQQKSFREGQQAHGEARKALRAGEHDAAARSARRCAELAEPLGDWWGTAMGCSAEGMAHQAAGKHEAALVPLTRARMIYHDLGLTGSEYQNLRALVDSLVALERKVRARHSARQALALATALGDKDGSAELERVIAGLEAE